MDLTFELQALDASHGAVAGSTGDENWLYWPRSCRCLEVRSALCNLADVHRTGRNGCDAGFKCVVWGSCKNGLAQLVKVAQAPFTWQANGRHSNSLTNDAVSRPQ